MKKIFALVFTMVMCCSMQAFAKGRVIEFESPRMTVYLPPQPNGRAIVACPGGGYSHLATDHEGHNWAPFYNQLGYAYAVLEYRMPGGDRSIPMGDVEAAFKLMVDSADQWHFKADKIGIMGSSAGGHLASTMATHPGQYCKPAFQVLFYPVISLENDITHQGTRRGFLGEVPTDELAAAWSNFNNVTAQTPPAFLALSSDDKAVPAQNSLRYVTALVENGVPASLHIYPVGGHGWGYRTTFKYHQQVLAELAAWLKTLPLDD